MPTVYRQSRKSLTKNTVSVRDLEIWEKHCAERGINPKKTAPAKHPHTRKTP